MDALTDEGYNDVCEEPKNEIPIPHWVTALTEDQRVEFAVSLLLTLPTSKLAEIHHRIAPLLHRDFLALLPYELSIHVLSFLDAQTLCCAARVSKKWREITSDGIIWRRLFLEKGWSVNKKLVDWYLSSYTDPYASMILPSNDVTNNGLMDTGDGYKTDSVQDETADSELSVGSSDESSTVARAPRRSIAGRNSHRTSQCSRFHGNNSQDVNNTQYGSPADFAPQSGSPRRYSTAGPSTIHNTSIISQAYSSNEELLDSSNQMSDTQNTTLANQFSNGNASSSRGTPLRHCLPTSTRARRRQQVPLPPTPIPAHFPFPPSAYTPYNLLMHRNQAGMPSINWKYLYHQRSRLDSKWRQGKYETRELPGHSESIYCIQFDEHKIISGSRDDTIKVWDIKTGYCVRTYRGHKASVLCLQYDDKIIVSGSSDATIIIWDLATGEILRTLEGHTESVLNLRFNDTHIVSCSKDRTVRIWRRDSLKRPRVLEGHRAAVNAIQFQDDYVVSASGDRTIKLWSLSTGECIRTFDGHSRGIACIQFDGRIIVSGSSDRTIKVFDVQTGLCIRTLIGHEDLVRTLQFEGNRIVSGSYDETVKVWDLQSGELVANLAHVHNSRVFKLQFNATKIVSCSQDQKIVVWDFARGIDTTFLV
ncbi:1493_t:CDS:2 [Paraglomus occultum]|uniref:1493_t:CDS:1 n=1 Tax=Paraglomus occultum TaxID=144539 RepID=A0A9N9AVK2_9GLOM|nr:1493_t:CDS:2 [Paraglomus occultum]